MNIRLVILFLSFFSLVKGEHLMLDSLPNYPFIHYANNVVIADDSNSIVAFYEKLHQLIEKADRKVKVLHLGDSHVQGGWITEEVRSSFHHAMGCGTQERGFLFPYRLAQSNNPTNYKIDYSGIWKGCRSAFVNQECNWGLSGFTATSFDDTASFQVKAKNFEEAYFQFKSVDLFVEYDTASFDLEVQLSNGKVLYNDYDTLSKCLHLELEQYNDSIQFFWSRKNESEDSVVVHGVSLLNDLPGLCYSEAGCNGAKVNSVLSSKYFLPQLEQVDPDLLLISLGTNDAFSLLYEDTVFVQHYDSLLTAIRTSLPNLPILITTPGDGNRYRNRHIKENRKVRTHLFKLAQKHHCAIWDWYTIMGGAHSVERWFQQGLTSRDRIHLNEQGYRLQGKLLYNALMNGYYHVYPQNTAKPLERKHGKNWGAFLERLYKYRDNDPMIFNSPVFWLLFVPFFLLYLLIRAKTGLRSWYLFLFSLFFYYKTGEYYFTLLLLSTVVDFALAWAIFKATKKRIKQLMLFFSLLVNLGLLAFYKYADFIVESINVNFGTKLIAVDWFSSWSNGLFGTHFDISSIALPVGISFYTFQTLSYSIDVYRGKLKPLTSIIDFGFYVTFFPQLVAGPIVRASEFIPQIHQKFSLGKKEVTRALSLIIGGLIKKVIISDYIASNFVDRVFESPLRYSGIENLMAVYGYAMQIYCDFSAYSDIAIALALLMGFTLPDNFNQPYLSANITSFWRRWHMSLSAWLKDYLYISLGGNRKGKIRTSINLLFTMLLGGLWHGAALRFIIWGGLHGLALVVHKIFTQLFPKLSNSKHWLITAFSWALTFHFVAYCWVFFRAPDTRSYQEMLLQIRNAVYNWSAGEWVSIQFIIEVIQGHKEVMSLILLGYLFHFIPKKALRWTELQLFKIPSFTYPVIVFCLVWLLFQFSGGEAQPFIYFQF